MERSREELDTRLKRQIQFIVEVDKVMTQNIPGIWRLWQYF